MNWRIEEFANATFELFVSSKVGVSYTVRLILNICFWNTYAYNACLHFS